MRALKLRLLQLYTLCVVIWAPRVVYSRICITNSAEATEIIDRSTPSARWFNIPTIAPEARSWNAMSFGPGVPSTAGTSTTSHVYVYGGQSMYYRACFQDLWRLDLDTMRWEKLWGKKFCTEGEIRRADDVPASTRNPTLTYLEPNVLISFGGKSCSPVSYMGDAWHFDVTRLKWTRLEQKLVVSSASSSTKPSLRWMHTAVVLPVRVSVYSVLVLLQTCWHTHMHPRKPSHPATLSLTLFSTKGLDK
eukprot:2801614-Pyramimonas_sp.AAC.1